jgi:7-cyano-7-deazaguanine synthase in queuosine biosynthesis
MRKLVLFSGGLKSLFLANFAKREGEVVLCYLKLGVKNGPPERKLSKLAKELQLPLLKIPIEQTPLLEEPLLRMLYLIFTVLPIAKHYHCHSITHGISLDDDKRIQKILDQYMSQLNDLVMLAQPTYDGKGHWLGNVEIETPLRQLQRTDIIRLGQNWQLDWSLTHSCSEKLNMHCGECVNCEKRKKAFRDEKIEDPTIYLPSRVD